ncbi:MAG: PAS domain S-box protein [Bacteroidota bacterium]
MSLVFMLTGLLLRVIAFFKAINMLRKKRDWRLITLSVIILITVINMVIHRGATLSNYDAIPVGFSFSSFLYGVAFLVAVNLHERVLKAYSQQKRKLSDHVNLFEQFAYSAPLACFIFQDQKIVFANHAATTLTGFTHKELLALEPHLIAAPDSQDYLVNLNTNDDEITSIEISLELAHKMGDTRWGLASFGSAAYNGKPATVGTILDVTKQKTAEQEIQKAEERIRIATNASNTVVWDVDLTTETSSLVVPVSLENEYDFIEGISREEILRCVYEPDLPGMEKIIEASYHEKTGFNIDYRRYNKAGELRWWHLQGKAQFNNEGKPVRLSGTSRCIHEQKIAEEAVQENEARLRIATEIAGIQVWEWEIGSEEVNHIENGDDNACKQVTGYADFVERLHPDHRERVIASVTNAITNGVRYEEEFLLRDNNGEYFWQLSVGQILYNENGEPAQMIGAALDTTERRQKEELIRFQADLLDKIGQNIVSQNKKGELTYLNKAAQKAFGIDQTGGGNVDISNLLPDNKRIKGHPGVIDTLQQGEQWIGEITAHTLYGTSFPIFLSASPLFDEQGEYDGFVAISTDMSAYKEIQVALQDSEERLRLALDAASLVVWDVDLTSGNVVHSIPSSINAIEAKKFNSMQTILSSFHPGDQEKASFQVMQCIEKNKPLYIEHRFIDEHGAFDWWQTSGKMYNDHDGNPTRMIGTSQMITIRKEAELQLQQRMNQLQAIYNIADAVNKGESLDSIYLTAADGTKKAIGANRIAILILNPETEEIEFAFHDGLSATYREAMMDHCPWNGTEKERLTVCVSEGDLNSELGPLAPYAAEEGILSLGAFPLMHKDNLLGKFMIFFDDTAEVPLTDRQFVSRMANHVTLAIVKYRNEETLKARTIELQTIADTIPDAIFRIGDDLNMKFANKTVLQSSNMTMEEFTRLDAYSFGCPPDLNKEWISTIKKVIKEKRAYELDFQIEDPADGTKHFQALLAPESTTETQVGSALAVIRDITEERQLQQTIIDISARQQRNIGQDLHDELGQLLTGIGFKIAGLQRDLDELNDDCAEQNRDISQLVEKAISQTRMLAEGLNPVTLEVHGIRAGLEKLALNTENTFGVSCPFTCDEDFNIEDEETAVQLYRIGQEAINNAVKHASPTQIEISLKQTNGKAELVVEDDGNGFTHALSESDGHGLRIMNYRARVIGAVFSIDTVPKKGTTVRCTFKNNTIVQQK